MTANRELGLNDYREILRRRWLMILLPVLLGGGVGYGLTRVLPPRYTSQALMLVEQQSVPASFVQPVISEDVTVRVSNIQEQVLSRTRLLPIIERYGLFRDAMRGEPIEAIVARLREDISLTPVKPVVKSRDMTLLGFYIDVTLSDPRVAQQVCTEISSMFIEEDLRQRQQSAQDTTKFLETQLAEAKRRLDEQDARLAEFKRKYMGLLPDETQSNFNMLLSLNSQLQAVTNELNRIQQAKAHAESLLTQEVGAWRASRAVTGPLVETPDQQLTRLESELKSMQLKYTSNHPDVIRMKTMVEELRTKASEDAASARTTRKGTETEVATTEPPEVRRLRSQLQAYQKALDSAERERGRLEKQIEVYQSRLQLTPAVEQQYKEITRDHQTALEFYNDLLRKRNQSEMATNMEIRQKGEQIRVMDPANLPETPSFPKLPVFLGGGFGAGLALGLGLAFLLELQDKTIRTEQDIATILGTRTLALIPVIAEMRERKTARS